jgi:hypothetical protein
MKNLALFALAVTLFTGCSDSNTVEIPVSEYKKLKGDTLQPKYPKKIIIYHSRWNQDCEISLGSDGCEYLEGNIGTSSTWCIHYPQCSNPIHRDTCKCK